MRGRISLATVLVVVAVSPAGAEREDALDQQAEIMRVVERIRRAPQYRIPCERVRSEPERTICDTPELATLDHEANAVFMMAWAELHEESGQALEREQRAWVEAAGDACGGELRVRCLERRYIVRIDELGARAGESPRPRADPDVAPGSVPHGCRPLAARFAADPHWKIDSPNASIRAEWCLHADGARGILVSVADPGHPWAGCPDRIPVWGGPMGGVILPDLSRDPYVAVPALDGFFAVSGDPNTPESPGPAGVEPTGPGIVIDAGGAGAHLYCHAGRWWVHGYH